MVKNTPPEKLYFGFLKLGALFSVISFFIFSIVAISLMRSAGFEISFLWSLLILLLAIMGAYLNYLFVAKIYAGKAIKEENQRMLKQFVYLIFPFMFLLLLILSSAFIEKYGLIPYIIEILSLIFVWCLFFWRLKNIEKEQGKDGSSILDKTDIISIIIFITVVAGIFYFMYKSFGW